MESIDSSRIVDPRFSTIPISVSTLVILSVCLYLLLLGVYRLFITPYAKFPGPKLAALTYWYEFYYDVWKEGQYTWKIRDLHRKYGMRLVYIGV